ncbi:MAG TPA: thiamine phosphate synthase [Candidatus Acidoferrales bacterium]|nr:thiamine phosphate synthase [Candidatus Acidoferrales bacterium]
MPDPRTQLEAALLYAITPDAEPEEVERLVAAYLRGGVDVVQLRHKSLVRGRLLELACRLRRLTAESGRLFVVNDHLDVALVSRADGVHLGADDLSLPAARRVAGPDLLLGASASTALAARKAVGEGADYIGCGAAFATPVKSGKRVIGPRGVARVAAAVAVPVFAIGGVEETNLPRLLKAGVRRVCVIRALAGAPDPEAAARRLRRLLAA